MVEVELGSYLNTETTKDGDIGEVTGEGAYNEKEIKGQKKRILDVPCKVGEKTLIYSPPWKVLRAFSEAWGKNTKDWINKKFQITHREIEVAGKDMTVVRAAPLDQKTA